MGAKMYDGRLTIPVPGQSQTLWSGVDTRTQYPDAPVEARSLTLHANRDNDKQEIVMLGGRYVSAADATAQGMDLRPGQPAPRMDVNLKEARLDVITADDGVHFTFLGPDDGEPGGSNG